MRGKSPLAAVAGSRLAGWFTLSWAVVCLVALGPPLRADDTVPAAPVQAAEHDEDGVPKITDVRPSRFQEFTPGQSTVEELTAALGEPQEKVFSGGLQTLVYKVGPFPRVEFLVDEGVMDSVVIHLAAAVPAADIAKELGLTGFEPAKIQSEDGTLLGCAYPERGIAFSYTPERTPVTVSQLILEPISAELFVLRARGETGFRYARQLADLNYAVALDPQHAGAHWRRAMLYARIGSSTKALSSIEEALKAEPNAARFLLVRAALQLELSQLDASRETLDRVFERDDLSPLESARAQLVLGNHLAASRQFQKASEAHRLAVEQASELAATDDKDRRREARRVLIEAQLGLANDITRGTFESKEEAAPKWLQTASQLVDETIEQDGADPALRLLLLGKALACFVGMEGRVDPAEVVEQVIRASDQLAEDADDPLRKRHVRWELVSALFDAVRIEQMRGDTERVVAHGNRAIELLNEIGAPSAAPSRADHLIGRLYFYMGSTFAIRHENHTEAVRWYEKALPYLSRKVPANSSGRNGQRLVSMGVSYWQTNVRNEAVRLTEEGLRMMQQAVQQGVLPERSLAVPYGNLSAMYKALGRTEEAEQLASKAARLEPSGNRK